MAQESYDNYLSYFERFSHILKLLNRIKFSLGEATCIMITWCPPSACVKFGLTVS